MSESELQILQDTESDNVPEQHLQPEEQEEASKLKQYPTLQSTVSGLKRLHAVITNTNLTNDERQNQHIYIGACQSLQKVVEAFHRSGSIGRILVWPLYISTSFLSLLEAKDPIALLIFIHYGVALDLISHRWVVQDSGKRLVQALIPSLRCAAVQAKQDWVQIIEWARNTVGLVGGPEDLGAVCEERIN